MPDIGQLFKEARERKKVTPSQAAAATRMKVQHVEALERSDFRKMAAPAYVRGFIKMYAEYLGLDPAPLIQQYMEENVPGHKPSLQPPPPTPPPQPPGGPAFSIPWPAVKAWLIQWKKAVLGVAVVLALVLLFSVNRCARPRTEEAPATPPQVEAPVSKSSAFSVLEEPPEPYLDNAPLPEGSP